MRAARWGVVCVALAAAVASSVGGARPALAQDEGALEQLRKRFFEGIALEEQGKWAEALEVFREVAKAKTSPQVRYHVALCDENLGRIAAAVAGYEEALALAQRETGEAAEKVRDNAQKRAQLLRPRVPRVTIVRAAGDAREVLLDGEALDAARLGKPFGLEPGRHAIAVRDASGEESTVRTVELAEGGYVRVDIPDPNAKPASGPGGGPKVPPPDAPPPAPGGGGSRLPAYVVGGVGAAALVGGGVLFGMSQGAASDVKAACPAWETGACPPELEARADEGRTLHTVSFVVGGVGVAALATAAVLFFTADADPAPAAGTVRLVPFAPAGAAPAAFGSGVAVEARF